MADHPTITATAPDIGVPACDPTAGPHATGRNGYDWDSYAGQGQLEDYWSPNVPFHNSRQRHVSQEAWFRGITATSIKEIPPCPPKWTDVQHYWDTVALAGWLFYEYGLNSKGSFMVRVVEMVGSVGAVELVKQYGLPMIGIA